MITLEIEGQTLELPEEVAVNDDALRKAIAPLFPQATNARFERVTGEQGRTVIKITKQAGTKGAEVEDIARALQHCPRHINPALALHQKLTGLTHTLLHDDLLHLERELELAIKSGEQELKVTNAILMRLIEAPAVPGRVPPVGF